ncbi:MAG: hypothetical protein PHH24_02860 [Candidatus Moranbacteria bacterium]|nr:hypothetical protein [Candidatus Moranbacteria bacterium]
MKKIFLSKKNLRRDVVIVSLVALVSFSAVRAGNLDSPGSPASTMYTLGDIYERLTTNQAATEADHDFAPSADPAGSLRTLKEIYEAIPTVEADKVKSGTSYLGIAGNLLPSGGTAGVANVLAGQTFFGSIQSDWNLQTGTMPNIGQEIFTPGTADQAISLGYHDGTGYVSGDADLLSANIRSGVNLFGIDGNTNVVNTSSGDATAGEILSGKIAWVDGAEITGTIPNIGTQNITPSTSNQTISEGYHDGTGTVSGDSDLVAGNIKTGADIFGVAGTLLADQFNGSATSPTDDFALYTLEKGGIDDYNSGGSMPGDAYSANWTQCTSSNSYCGTNDSTACAGDVCWMDNDTGMIWSDWLDSGTDRNWWWANNCYQPGTPENPDGGEGDGNGTPDANDICDADGDDACQCVKKEDLDPEDSDDDKTGCESLGDGNWILPHQKQLMQAYINGSWGNLPHAGYGFWSATTNSYATQNAWRVNLHVGLTNTSTKATVRASRCVYSSGN